MHRHRRQNGEVAHQRTFISAGLTLPGEKFRTAAEASVKGVFRKSLRQMRTDLVGDVAHTAKIERPDEIEIENRGQGTVQIDTQRV